MSLTSHTALESASNERKARLAKLASLKRKQPPTDSDTPTGDESFDNDNSAHTTAPPSKTDIYLSGRNYDVSARGPRLGFESSPAANANTLEQQAETISKSTQDQAAKDEIEAAEKGLDLFKLQPKKPNWDLKRDLAEKMKVVDVQTKNAIARLVRERIERTKREALEASKRQEQSASVGAGTSTAEVEGEEIGISGNELVEGIHLREKEEQEEEEEEAEDQSEAEELT